MTELNIGRPRPATQRTRMTTGRFARVFFTDNFARFYLVTSIALTAAALVVFGISWGMALAALVSLVLLSLLEYVIHRWLLHNQLFYRHPLTARVWRHLHYAHHMDPTETGGMIGPPQYAIPVMLLVTLPLGWMIGGWAGAAGSATEIVPSGAITGTPFAGSVIGPPSPITGYPSPLTSTPEVDSDRSPRRV